MELTSGTKTTEFYVTLVSGLVGILTMAGYVEPSRASELTQNLIVIIGAVMTIVPAITYIVKRSYLKSQLMKSQMSLVEKGIVVVKPDTTVTTVVTPAPTTPPQP